MSPAEHERLAILMEEMGESIQVIGKILRHGYSSHHPNGGASNRQLLEIELGHVLSSIKRLARSADINLDRINNFSDQKDLTIIPYLHHQVIK